MVKPRIIIADTDMNYMIPLQQRFIEEYFEKIDLEIISEKSYFEQLFSSPQKADVLIVSEKLYSPVVDRHDITNIFVMTEQRNENQRDYLNIEQIYKYTNINDVFYAITGKSRNSLRQISRSDHETQIILVYAGSGGVGKTTIALGVCACLNESHRKVLYMNADLLQTFQVMLANTSPVTSADIYADLANPDENIYSEIKHVLRNEGFYYLPPFRNALISLDVKYSVFEKIAVSAKKTGEYDYILIDADAAFDEYKVELIDIADKVIIVTKQNKASVYATNILVSNINGINTDKYIFVCNDFDENDRDYLVSPDIIKKFNITEYVGHLSRYDQLKINDLANDQGIQKIAYMVS